MSFRVIESSIPNVCTVTIQYSILFYSIVLYNNLVHLDLALSCTIQYMSETETVTETVTVTVSEWEWEEM